MSKIFKMQTGKINFSTMPNIAKTISAHNKTVLNPRTETQNCKSVKPPSCQSCPINGLCVEMDVAYKCRVTQTASGVSNTCVGVTAETFKDF